MSMQEQVRLLEQRIKILTQEVFQVKEELQICQNASINSFYPIKNNIIKNQKFQTSLLKKNTFLSLEQAILKKNTNMSLEEFSKILEEGILDPTSSFLSHLKNLSEKERRPLLKLLKTRESKENIKNWVFALSYLYNMAVKEDEDLKST